LEQAQPAVNALIAMTWILRLLHLVRLLTEDRQRLALENIALRHQLAVLRRSVNRPRIHDSDRVFWILMMRALKDWKDAVHIVKPETVLRWHKKGFRYNWRRKSKGKQGRPPISFKLIHLIRRLSMENTTWGAPKIASELALLGHTVAESTVAKYMVKAREPKCSQRWGTFIRNHMDVTAACDFFVVPTATFKVMYVFVVLSHARREILHVNVTEHPTAAWTARQIREAFPWKDPRMLLHDRDRIYGWEFNEMLKARGIRSLRSSPRSPWQNAYAERVIGTLRRECTDHIIPLGRRHLLRVLNEYVEYYNQSRPHQSLERDAPLHRPVERIGDVCARPVLNGRYFVHRL
jgi:putative transposase